MIQFKRLLLAAAAVALSAGIASAQTTVKWLHLEVNPNQVKIWEEAARAFEAKNPGVKIEMQFLENEAYKAKLPTLLQSKDKPNIIYSWAGGVLQSQVEAGVIEDITEPMKGYTDTLAPAAVEAFKVNGKNYGIPVQRVAGRLHVQQGALRQGRRRRHQDQDLGRPARGREDAQGAGITPIMVGGADKWPLHFYWTHLAVRIGGKPAIEAAMKGEDGGFESRDLREVGRALQAARRPAALPERLPRLQEPAGGRRVRRRQGRDVRSPSAASTTRRRRSRRTRSASPTTRSAGSTSPPCPAARATRPTRSAASMAGSSPRARRRRPSTSSSSSSRRTSRRKLAAGNFIVPVVKGADEGIASPFMQNIAANLAKSKFHQNFYDQMLGPSVGRVINDASAEIAGGSMTPKEAAKAVNDAWKQGN